MIGARYDNLCAGGVAGIRLFAAATLHETRVLPAALAGQQHPAHRRMAECASANRKCRRSELAAAGSNKPRGLSAVCGDPDRTAPALRNVR